jgi:hypothetical protein
VKTPNPPSSYKQVQITSSNMLLRIMFNLRTIRSFYLFLLSFQLFPSIPIHYAEVKTVSF